MTCILGHYLNRSWAWFKLQYEEMEVFILLSLFWQNESRLMMRSPCWLWIPPPPNQPLNARTSLYETWYVYHGTWAHLNSVLRKFLPSVSLSVCIFPYRC
jgi:hypothetical protein